MAKNFIEILIGLMLVIISISNSSAQNHIWSKNAGSTGNDGGNSIITDNNGNIYSCGYFYNTFDFDPGENTVEVTSNGSADIYITKQDDNGNLLWVKTLGGSGTDRGYSIVEDHEGFLYITGHYYGSMDFDPGVDEEIHTSTGLFDIFLLKLDINGEKIWAKTFGGADIEYGRSLAVDPENNVCMTGFYSQTVDFDPEAGVSNLTTVTPAYYDVFIAKYDNNGNHLWSKSIGGPNMEDAFSIATDSEGSVFATGYYEGSADINPGPENEDYIAEGAYDVFIIKLDAGGEYLWSKTIGGAGSDIGRAITCDADDNVIISGLYNESIDADPGSGEALITSLGFTDAFIVKLDNNGETIWTRSIGGTDNDEAKTIITDNEGNLFVSGWYGSTVAFNGTDESNIFTSEGGNDVFITKYHPDGSFGWVKTFGGTSFDFAYSLTADATGSLYVTGNFSGTADFDPGDEMFSLDAAGGSDIYLTKLCFATLPEDAITGQVDACEGAESIFSYNPSNYITSYDWQVPVESSILNGQNSNEISVQFGSGSGEVILTTQNACGMTHTTNLPVIIHQSPIISLAVAPSSTICEGENFTLTADGANDYSWSDGVINGNENQAVSSRQYYIEATSEYGCITQDSVYIFVNPQPVINIQASSSEICAQESITLTASGAELITWDNGVDISQPITITETSTFHAFGTDVNGCSAVAEITITAHDIPDVVANASAEEICYGSSVTLFGSGAEFYTWNNDVIDNTPLNILGNMTFTVTGIDEFGCIGEDEISINVHEVPVIMEQPQSQTASVGDDVVITISTETPATTYRWQQSTGTGFEDLFEESSHTGVMTPMLELNDVTEEMDGYYYRCIITSGPCTEFSEAVILNVLDNGLIDLLPLAEINVFPNPADDFIQVKNSTSLTGKSYLIVDNAGRIVVNSKFNNENARIDLTTVAAGSYVLICDGKNTRFIVR